MSFVIGEDNVAFIKSRVATLKKSVLFEKMKLSQDEEEMKSWLMIEGRKSDEPIALTYDETGTDVNFGALTAKLFENLEQRGVGIQYKQNVLDIKKQKSGHG